MSSSGLIPVSKPVNPSQRNAFSQETKEKGHPEEVDDYDNQKLAIHETIGAGVADPITGRREAAVVTEGVRHENASVEMEVVDGSSAPAILKEADATPTGGDSTFSADAAPLRIKKVKASPPSSPVATSKGTSDSKRSIQNRGGKGTESILPTAATATTTLMMETALHATLQWTERVIRALQDLRWQPIGFQRRHTDNSNTTELDLSQPLYAIQVKSALQHFS